jgi:hypothetical protein
MGPPGPRGPPGPPGRPRVGGLRATRRRIRVAGLGAAGADAELLGRTQNLADPLANLSLGQGTQEAVHQLAADNRDDHRNALHLECLAEARIGVHVDLGQDPLAARFSRQLLQHRAELLARAAPLRPQVDDHRRRT